MNDRPQAGSADLSEGNVIELMQNRRNQEEPGIDGPNEVNTFDNTKGIRVNARYYMQIFDTKLGKSLQRDQQIALQEPLQQYFAFNYSLEAPKVETAPESNNTSENNTSGNNTTGNNTNANNTNANTTENNNNQNKTDNEKIKPNYYEGDGFTYRLIPMAKNKVMVRFENLEDTFDNNTQTVKLSVWKFANELFQQVNGKAPLAQNVEETFIGGSSKPSQSSSKSLI